jgi:ELWxxDGT repeat protein
MLVKDINPGPNDSTPQGLAAVGSEVFFSADDGAHGAELWKSDGTAQGTVMVKDIRPGLVGSSPAGITKFHRGFVFNADSGVWRSDGTRAGTKLIDRVDGAGFTILGDNFYFSTGQLWRSDGTRRGTRKISDPKLGRYDYYPAGMIVLHGILYFGADTNGPSEPLWRTDGTPKGTWIVKPEGYPSEDVVFHGRLLVAVFLSALWSSDGTGAGTTVLMDGYYSRSTGSELTVTNRTVFFFGSDRRHGGELWRTDGTEAGTKMIRDITPGPRGSLVEEITAAGNLVYFLVLRHGRAELWKSDGSNQGTVPVAPVIPGKVISAVEAGSLHLTMEGDHLFFAATDPVHGRELWTSDGTRRGTHMVSDVNAGATRGSRAHELTNAAGTLYFVADDSTHGFELWKSDGTTAGTALVIDIRPGPKGSDIEELTAVGSTVFFVARDGKHGPELWKSDGTASGTVIVQDILPGYGGSDPAQLTDANGVLFFFADDGSHGIELWRSDGTEGGTVLVDDVEPGPKPREIRVPRDIGVSGSRVFFQANDGVHGLEPWVSDGTASGTALTADVNPGPRGSFPFSFTAFKGDVFFSTIGGGNDRGLWKTDGSRSGTVRVSAVSGTLTALPDVLLSASGSGLWRTDGTAQGTARLVAEPEDGCGATGVTSVGSKAFFFASDGMHGDEPWVTDGTAVGTSMVRDVHVGRFGGLGRCNESARFILVTGSVFFRAWTVASGRELWRTDGTASGTGLLADLNPGPRDSSPSHLAEMSGHLYFVANDGVHGGELWRL